MSKVKQTILNAEKQKDKRTLVYDPKEDNVSILISEFQAYKKEIVYVKDYSEMEIFAFFKEIRWMKIIDEKNETEVFEALKRQNKIRIKYENYVEYTKWSDSPLAQTTKPLSQSARIGIISGFVALFIVMLLIIIGLNKWW
ncbi:hypothetical protein [Metamycoplasma buccale]|uniref:hypothetical protein n=1 Tax=Metamycoplasma buccale TaxID=55602 RepID=UPI00398E8E20